MKYEERSHPGLSNVLSDSNVRRPDIFITYFPDVLIALPLDIIFSTFVTLPPAPGGNLATTKKKILQYFRKSDGMRSNEILNFEIA